MIFSCCEDEARRNDLRGNPALNGIDFLEVDDDPARPPSQRQRALLVHFINDLRPGQLDASQIRIDGGERIRNVRVTGVVSGADDPSLGDVRLLRVQLSEPGDFSRYTFRLLADGASQDPLAPPPDGFDVGLSSVAFEFKAACETAFDCLPAACPPSVSPPVDIDYLAKDYASFRQLLLDRMAALAPGWGERHAADLGIVLVEILAYVGDYLSYKQDAVATEAYLGTARQRASVRRHARLVDYPMHDGRNARTWVAIAVSQDVRLEAAAAGEVPTQFLTADAALAGPLVRQDAPEYAAALRDGATVFELVDAPPVDLRQAHNRIRFHTWGALDCCLPRGATQADLRGALPDLTPGNVLIFVEVKGPSTGQEPDADPAHRHAARLTKVSHLVDPIGGHFDDPRSESAVDVTRVEWSTDDALPFPLCVSSRAGAGGAHVRDVSVALGNVVLADHGATVAREDLGEVPEPNPALTLPTAAPRCAPPAPTLTTPRRFRPRLARGPLAYGAAYDPAASATAALTVAAESAVPSRMTVYDSLGGVWLPRPDLLASHADDRDVVVESDDQGRAFIRFGDGTSGAPPQAGAAFSATYRVGGGTAGNLGPDSLRVVASNDAAAAFITAVRNPLAARGGLDPEPLERVRQNAPVAFRVQERAVTTDDYADVARRCVPDVQRARARFRWTGSWQTVFLTVDRLGGRPVDQAFTARLRGGLEPFRMAGHDLEVREPQFVSLEIEMRICVNRDYFVANVLAALRDAFSDGVSADGTPGFFHPDRFTFGQPVLLSDLYATAQKVKGVASVEVVKLQRQGVDSDEALRTGLLEIGTLEIARLDNDPNFREHGVLTFTMAGGR